jgi:hypothetical protein
LLRRIGGYVIEAEKQQAQLKEFQVCVQIEPHLQSLGVTPAKQQYHRQDMAVHNGNFRCDRTQLKIDQ